MKEVTGQSSLFTVYLKKLSTRTLYSQKPIKSQKITCTLTRPENVHGTNTPDRKRPSPHQILLKTVPALQTLPENVHGRKHSLLPQLHFHGKPSRLSSASQTTLPSVLAMRAVLTMMVSWPCWPCRSWLPFSPCSLKYLRLVAGKITRHMTYDQLLSLRRAIAQMSCPLQYARVKLALSHNTANHIVLESIQIILKPGDLLITLVHA